MSPHLTHPLTVEGRNDLAALKLDGDLAAHGRGYLIAVSVYGARHVLRKVIRLHMAVAVARGALDPNDLLAVSATGQVVYFDGPKKRLVAL
jgi:hypothetical protein